MELFKTDMGLISIDNLDYLTRMSVLDNQGRILYKVINNSQFRRPVQLWNMFCLIVADIKNTTGVFDINEIVTIMREGLNLERKYPRVESLVNKGTQLVFDSYKKGVDKKRSAREIDLDNF